MKITSVQISNFRGIKFVSLENLGAGVVIAGLNGCGKSCILDAIRLLKSAYGSYDQDEWGKWMQEAQININQETSSFIDLFQNKKNNLVISACFDLSTAEREFISENLPALLKKSLWSENFQPVGMMQPRRRVSLAENQRKDIVQLNRRISTLEPLIHKQLEALVISGKLEISPDGSINVFENHY